jgi:hypothetical protein
VGRPAPALEHCIRAFELLSEGRSLREAQEILARELGPGVAPRSHETVRSWAKTGAEAASWLNEDAKSEGYTSPEFIRRKYVSGLGMLISRGFDEMDKGDGAFERVAPILLRAMREEVLALGGYAPTRVQLQTGDGSAPEVPRDTKRTIDAAMRCEDALLTGEEDS